MAPAEPARKHLDVPGFWPGPRCPGMRFPCPRCPQRRKHLHQVSAEGKWLAGGKCFPLHWQTLCQGRLRREGTSPQHHASFTRMMPSKADRCGLTDSGRMRDEQRCGLCSKVCGDTASNQAITGSFTSVIASPEWAQGCSWVPSDTKTQQGKRQLQAAGEGERNAGWVSPGRYHTLTQGKGWFCCR